MDDIAAADARALLARAERRSVRITDGRSVRAAGRRDRAARLGRRRRAGAAPSRQRLLQGRPRRCWPSASRRASARSRWTRAVTATRARPEAPGSYAWARFAEDLVGVAERVARSVPAWRGFRSPSGHSFGGTSLLGAAKRRPDLFDRIVLVDPVVPPRLEEIPPERREHVFAMVERAGKRRHDWPSPRRGARVLRRARALRALRSARARPLRARRPARARRRLCRAQVPGRGRGGRLRRAAARSTSPRSRAARRRRRSGSGRRAATSRASATWSWPRGMRAARVEDARLPGTWRRWSARTSSPTAILRFADEPIGEIG